MANNLKSYKLETKENFILYLRCLIIMAHKHIGTYKRYLEDLNKYLEDGEYNKKKSVAINPFVYFRYQDKMNNVSTTLLNLIGDETKTAMSYRKFRNQVKKRQEKGLELGLPELNKEIQFIVNEFNNLRNWSLHIPESLFTAQVEIVKKYDLEKCFMNDLSTIIVPEFEAYEVEWLIDLLKEHKNLYSGSRKVFQQMKRDYSILVGETMIIQKKHYKIRSIKDIDIPKISYEIQQRKYNGVGEGIWIPKI